MNTSESYREGFRKTAEALGFSADELEKEAIAIGDAGALVGKGIGALGKAFRRSGQLVTGSGYALKGYRAMQGDSLQKMLAALKGRNFGQAGAQVKDMFRTSKNVLRGMNTPSAQQELAKVYGTRLGIGGTAAGLGVAGAMSGGHPHERLADQAQQSKTAEAKPLSKAAAGFLDKLVGSGKYPYDPGIVSNLLANEHLRRGLAGAAVAGTTAAVTSDKKNKLRNALLAAAAGGVGTAAASSTGVLDNLLSPYSDINGQARKFLREGTAREITRSLRGPDTGSFAEKVRKMIESNPHKTHQLTFQR